MLSGRAWARAWARVVLEACSGQARPMSGHGPARSIGPHFLIGARPKFSCRAEHSPVIFVLVPCRASFKWAGLVPCWADPSRLTPLDPGMLSHPLKVF
ncbi:unnamed protein product [Prunus armeniaca]